MLLFAHSVNWSPQPAYIYCSTIIAWM